MNFEGLTPLTLLQVGTDVIFDIQNAINAGKEVTVSKTNITYAGWTGSGYIIIDPDTGDGAYMISGGLGGARLKSALKMLVINLYLLPSGRGFDEVAEAFSIILEEFTALYDYLSKYLHCLVGKVGEQNITVFMSALAGVAQTSVALAKNHITAGIIFYILTVGGTCLFLFGKGMECIANET
jgi:hypothetical protein